MAILSLVEKNMTPISATNMQKGNKESYYDMPQYNYQKEYIAPAANLNVQRCTFQGAMKLTILIGQCFGLNPVLNFSESDASKLRFSYWSARCVYSYISVAGQMWLIILCVVKLLTQTESNLYANTSLMFYGMNSLTCVIFIHVASKWPELCQMIAKAETDDPNLDMKIVRKCNVACITILAFAFVEHFLADLAGLSLALDCQPGVWWYKAFLLQSFALVWTFFNYNTFLGMYAQFVNFQCTFNWNFADAFVICISHYLTSRLKQVTERVEAMRGKSVPCSFWRTMREDYTRTCDIVKKMDNVISGIIFISFANNLFIICLQLLHVLEDGVKAIGACDKAPRDRFLRGYEHPIYFMYSLGFLIGRSLAVSLIAARVHSASREPAFTLYDVPSASYCIEVQRFLDQIHADTVALSGLRFFSVKRGLVLTIAGTIVTYELVLMQFTGVTPTPIPTTTVAA